MFHGASLLVMLQTVMFDGFPSNSQLLLWLLSENLHGLLLDHLLALGPLQ